MGELVVIGEGRGMSVVSMAGEHGIGGSGSGGVSNKGMGWEYRVLMVMGAGGRCPDDVWACDVNVVMELGGGGRGGGV